MDDKAQKIIDWARNQGLWVMFSGTFYSNTVDVFIDGQSMDVTEYWTCEIGGGGHPVSGTYIVAEAWPALVVKLEAKLQGHGYG